jgi:hypothetical protein
VRLRVTFGARALVGANDGLDPETCAARHAEALAAALAREWPAAEIDVRWTDDRASTRAEASGCATDTEARGAERLALDLAWVVRQMNPWG